MKKLVLILLGILNVLSVKAQVQQDTFPWCPPGARWVYDGINPEGSPYRSLYILKYEGDTVIQNKNCKKIVPYQWNEGWTNLVFDLSQFGIGPFYLSNQNDTIFYWNVYKHYGHNVGVMDSIVGDSSFKIAYIFNANVGDSVEITSIPIMPCTFLLYKVFGIFHNCYVDSVYYQVLNGYNYRTVRMTEGPYWSIGREIIKNIGPINAFLPGPYHDSAGFSPTYDNSNCDWAYIMNTAHRDEHYRKLLCYYDPLRGSISFLPDVLPWNNHIQCDSTTYKQAKSHNFFETEENLIAYPNPVKKSLFIKGQDFDLNNANIDLYDVNGRCINKNLYRVADMHVIKEINIENLPNGVYFVQVIRNDGKMKTLRFVKE